MSYLNFAIELAALPTPGRYRISVNSPIGQTSVDVDSPFTTQEIDSLLMVLGREQAGVTPAQEMQAARDFGERIFNFLIRSHQDILAAYFASLERAGNDGLRIRLSVEKSGELARLPWEFLRDPSRDFLALSRSTPIVRYTPQLTLRRPLNVTIPLRVLVMISTPTNFPALDVEGEWQRLQEATAGLQRRGLLELVRMDDATLIALQRKLRSEDFHIFHYIGHSDFNPTTQQGVLVFESERDPAQGQIITGMALGQELGEESSIRLIVINSCHSARRPERDALTGIASGLVARGIPAVVAMQFAISDDAAKAFAEEFYRAISESLPIDTAVSEGRRAISNRVGNIEWAIPVLYMRSEDGVLFLPTMTATVKKRITTRTVVMGIAALFALAVLVGVLRVVGPILFPEPTPTPAAVGTPDLQVTGMRISPSRPAPGQIFRLSVTISNTGDGDSGPFRYSWDASLLPPVMQNSFVADVENIPPGASKNVSFPFSYGWWGSYNTQVVVDIDSQVREGDERNNRRPFEIVLSDVPFEIDFSLLPSNEIVNPPHTVGSDEFVPWNLVFAINEPIRPECADTSIQLLDASGDILLQPVSVPPLAADCDLQTFSITILRNPVSDARIEIVPFSAGEVTLTYYSDMDGTNPVFETTQQVTAGGPTLLGPDDDTPRQIRRIDVRVSDQPVRITRMILSPP